MNSLLTLFNKKDTGCAEIKKIMDALNATQAIIEFTPDGTILRANDNFCRTLGYDALEIQGQHHSLFVCPEEKNSTDYHLFWNKLANGEAQSKEFKRLAKGGRIVWIKAIYNPLKDENGRVYKVIKFASDITETKNNANLSSALALCQANVMLADLDNTIVYVNESARTMLKEREHQLKTALKDFSVAKLVGTSMDTFHTTPSHQRKLISSITTPYKTQIKVAGITFGLIATPWMDHSGVRIGTLIEWEDKTDSLALQEEAQKRAAENARIRQALDVCDTSVMLADTDMNIIYVNNAVVDMLKNREAAIKTAVPAFSVARLMGSNVDDFHSKPAHQRNLMRELKTTYKTDIKLAGLTFGLMASPIFNASGERLGTVVEWQDKTDRLAREAEERRISEENARVKQALDNVSTNVMIADADANIIYMNDAVTQMMKHAESDLRKVLPGFDASQLKGKNMDVFHKNPAHQRGLIAHLKSSYHGKAEVAGRTFTVIANPIITNGVRIGTVVEWADRTAEVAIEKEIDSMIDAAAAGDFTKQIKLEGKDGFFASISSNLNKFSSTVEIALNDILRMLGAMAKGDLSERITRDYSGAFGQLKTDANTTADKLTEVITRIRHSASSIGTAANEIAQGNADLSQRTEEQASALEETASSMEEMTSTVKQSSDNAQKANELASQAQQKAKQGGEVVSKAVQAMEEINAASKKISDIISVIDEIAFQTNLLALNAAVEAARAGEQGRGFAVVAGEVRNLAQRSAGAAKEIKELIRDSVTKVQDGRELVNASGKTLSEIVSAVEVVSVMMRDIASAAREQTSGIEQVNTAISQMDEMTQQNAALVEEATAAGQAMADQANNMNSVVDFFNFGQAMAANANRPIRMDTRRTAAPVAKAKHTKTIRPVAAEDEWEDF